MGIQLTAREIVGIDGRDFRTAISKLAQTKPDTFSILLFSPALEIAGRQFKEAGLLNKLTCIGEFGISQEPKLFEGLWYVDGAVGNDTFLKDYRARYKNIPTNEAPYVYDIVNMLIQACENFPGPAAPSSDQIADYLQSLPGYDGVVGHIKPDADGCFISQSVLKVIRNGQPVVIEN
jgi:ABC-type branched-subunit amino acid transport system substrate-binding protein